MTGDDRNEQGAVPAQLLQPQLRRWKVGDYTLLADSDVSEGAHRVESLYCVGGYSARCQPANGNVGETASTKSVAATGWQPSWGGQTVYVAKGDKDDVSASMCVCINAPSACRQQ